MDMMLRVMLRVVTCSHFHELKFPGMLCAFLFSDHVKKSNKTKYSRTNQFPTWLKQNSTIF